MSISAVTSACSWRSSTDPSATANGNQAAAAAFQASLLQWQDTRTGTQNTATSQSDQQGTEGVQHHHHRLSLQTDGGEKNGPGSIRPNTLTADIAQAMQAYGANHAASGGTRLAPL